MKLSDIGVIGLGVMGANLARNIESRGFKVSVFNRPNGQHSSAVEKFKTDFKDKNFYATDNLEDFVASLSLPRKIIIMVKAGSAVDDVIGCLSPLLSKGDIVIDGGNSDFLDTRRRVSEMEDKGFLYVGAGISGGEEGALRGASIMPSGSAEAWPKIKNIFRAIAAKADDGTPCCRWIGPDGAGHFVKTVHNAIEYADMQLISEAYYILKNCNDFSNGEISSIFAEWNNGELKSYLIEITSKILDAKEGDGSSLVDKILDVASQKGTGKWAVKSALDLGVSFSLISQAVFSRFMSSRFDERQKASKIFPERNVLGDFDGGISAQDVGAALYASKIMAYAQGFSLMLAASKQFGWNLDFSGIAKIWRKGCIIRSVFLDRIAAAFDAEPKLENIVFSDYFAKAIREKSLSWRRVVSGSMFAALPIPCTAAALSEFDALCTAKSAANIIQAQRDYFGAHTYERTDKPRGEFFHTQWLSFEREDGSKNLPKKI